MNITCIIPCHLPKATADALNRESGRIYNNVLVYHWRILRKKGIWLSAHRAEQLEDTLDGPTFLHAHSRDAAQQAFYKASKTIRGLRRAGHPKAFYPYKRRSFRPTIWKNTAIRLQNHTLRLSRARGYAPLQVPLTTNLHPYQAEQFKEVRLCWNRFGACYEWHIVLKVPTPIPTPPGQKAVAVSLGTFHPAAATNGEVGVVFSAKLLENVRQYTAYKLKDILTAQARYQPGSRRWGRLEAKKHRFLGQQARQLKDMEHKVSRAIVNWVVAEQANTLLIGNTLGQSVRWQLMQAHKLEDGQKNGMWLPYNLYRYLKYKAQRAGVNVVWVSQSLKTYACPACQQDKATIKGIQYQCLACKKGWPVDVVAANYILRQTIIGVSEAPYPTQILYRHPVWLGKRIRERAPRK